MAKTVKTEPVSAEWMLIHWRELVSVALMGLVVGLVGVALYYLFDKYVFDQIMCKTGADLGRCGDKDSYASGVAMVLVGAGALFSLVQQRVYRSLLVVLAVTVSLWNIFLFVTTLPWIVMLVVTALLFAVAYAAFTWIAQLKNLVATAVITVVVVVLVRLILLS